MTHSFPIPNSNVLKQVFGENDTYLKYLEGSLSVSVALRNGNLAVSGDEEDCLFFEKLVKNLTECVQAGYNLTFIDLEKSVDILRSHEKPDLKDIFMNKILFDFNQRAVTPKSIAQKLYVNAINQKDLVFGIGPAGTGKTYLAMATAVQFLNRKLVDRIILTRPAVEAGESLGFLPGTLFEKINPYLRPLYDALHDIVGMEKGMKMVEKGIIEVVPLAYMRGRTLNDSFIILDEAQNTTTAQIKMFLTRMGFGSKAVVTGDITQIDLPKGKQSGLVEVVRILKNIDKIEFCYFSDIDVIRHILVREIIRAFAKKSAHGK